MAKKIHMVATVAGFELTRSTASSKVYTHAWCVTDAGGDLVTYGFSGSKRLADNAAAQVVSWNKNQVRVAHVVPVMVYDNAAWNAWLAERSWRIYHCRPDGRKDIVNLSGNLPYRFKSQAEAHELAVLWNHRPGVTAGSYIAKQVK